MIEVMIAVMIEVMIEVMIKVIGESPEQRSGLIAGSRIWRFRVRDRSGVIPKAALL
jgi:hypothetical protein